MPAATPAAGGGSIGERRDGREVEVAKDELRRMALLFVRELRTRTVVQRAAAKAEACGVEHGGQRLGLEAMRSMVAKRWSWRPCGAWWPKAGVGGPMTKLSAYVVQLRNVDLILRLAGEQKLSGNGGGLGRSGGGRRSRIGDGDLDVDLPRRLRLDLPRVIQERVVRRGNHVAPKPAWRDGGGGAAPCRC